MSKRILIATIASVLFAGIGATNVQAKDGHKSGIYAGEFGRPGWYVGVGGGAAIDFLEDFFKDNDPTDTIEISTAGSFNARGGYRVWSWLAFEAMYEGAYGFNTEILGVDVSNFSSHSFVANMKLILPTWRIHPYIMVGPGAQYGDFDDEGVLPPLDFDTTRWDFVLRTAVGVDGYITENWLLNLELAPSIRFADYSNLGSQPTDNVTLTVSIGVQYRF